MNTDDSSGVGTVKYAGFWIRYVAYVIDGIILIIPNLVSFSIPQLIFSPPISAFVGPLLRIVVTFTYFVWLTHKYGATLGKKLVGITVKNDNFQSLSLGKVFVRETIGKILSCLILYIGYIMAAFTKRKQSLHDKLAGSVVIYKDPNKKMSAGVIVAIIIASILPIIVAIGIFASITLVSLNTARGKGLEAKTRSHLASTGVLVEQYYNDHKNSYSIAENCSMGVFASPAVSDSLKQVDDKGMICYANGSNYAYSAKLSANPSSPSFCVDSSGYFGEGVAVQKKSSNDSTVSCEKVK